MNFLAFYVATLFTLALGERENPQRKCLDTSRHKASPSFEKHLDPVCSHWEGDNVCCTMETTRKINNLSSWYRVDRHVCSNSPLSKSCLEFFQMDACLFECSPDLWEYGNIKGADGEERVQAVPLCESQCNAWFNACANDMTCTTDWTSPRKGGKSSNVTECTKCQTIDKKFGTAKNFCQMVWNNAYQVVKDDGKCFSFQRKTKPPTKDSVDVDTSSPKTVESNDDSGKSPSVSVLVNSSKWFIFAIGLLYFVILF